MKIELEQVEPAEIESRSMEIIESELPHEKAGVWKSLNLNFLMKLTLN